MTQYAKAELSGVNCGDKRLNKRVVKLLDTFTKDPTGSIPQACGNWADTQAAYRLFANENVNAEDILAPHYARTLERSHAYTRVLAIEDTTELDFNGQKIQGLGRLSHDAQRGMYLHPTYMVTSDRVPLGLLNVQKIIRGQSKAEDEAKADKTKESERWINGYAHVVAQAKLLRNTRILYVTDREGDMIDLARKAHDLGNQVDWLVRVQHNRVLHQTDEASPKAKLYDSIENQTPIVTIEFELKSRRKSKAKPASKPRMVTQNIYVQRVMLPDGNGGKIEVSYLLAQEENPPAGEEPIVWRLMSNLPVNTAEEAIQMIEWYRARWEIEMFFDILKNACKVEELQLSQVDRVECALALYLIVSWRIAHLMRMGRTCPEVDARLLFDEHEIEAIYMVSRSKVPDNPKLNDVILKVAKLGGFLGRKCDGEPGCESIWLGMQRLVYFVAGVQAVRESSA